MTKCTVCRSEFLTSILSFGIQPASNSFLSKDNGAHVNTTYPLSLGYCQQCGIIQLVDRMPIKAIRPRYNWLQYNEPEGHLDDLVKSLSVLPGINSSSRFLGITYKDRSTLSRMNQLGFTNTDCINENQFEYQVKPFGLETIQNILGDNSSTMKLQSSYGNADMIFVRHIIEHVYDITCFIHSLKNFLKPNGYMIFEFPDCERIFRMKNHPFVWEEHISYFTEASIPQFVKAANANMVWFKRYAYLYEDSLVIALHFGDNIERNECPDSLPQKSVEILTSFSNTMLLQQERWHQKLTKLRLEGKRIAIFGAGHLAVKLINFYSLKQWIDCVVDDHPDKIDLCMPGSNLPIIASTELGSRNIDICISTLNPESEIKVRKKLVNFFNAGGDFISAFIPS